MSETISAKHDDTLKLIALATMLIDHIGYLLYPQYFILRIIGRVSFPIFAYLVAVGTSRTRNLVSYGGRLLVFGLISQVPYNYFTRHVWYSFEDPNIFFTLFAGLLMIHFSRSKKVLYMMLLILVIMPLHLSYGYYGVLLIYGFYYTKENPLTSLIVMAFLSVQYYIETHVIVQSYAILALAIIFWMPKLGIHIHKWTAYWFYPIHLSLLFTVYYFWF